MGDQEHIDAFYWSHGPCCAGCDWWRGINSSFGSCLATPPGLPGRDRAASLGIDFISTTVPSGHAITKRDHHCGAFKDDFDWTTLPLMYRKQIGAVIAPGEKP